MNDLKFAFRQLLKNPGFTAVAVLTLALGIGTNTTMFSVVNSVLLRPLPYTESDRLMELNGPLSIPNFKDWQEQQSAFEELCLYRHVNLSVMVHGGEPAQVTGVELSASSFTALRFQPLVGRLFSADDDRVGATEQRCGLPTRPDRRGGPGRRHEGSETRVAPRHRQGRVDRRGATRYWAPVVCATLALAKSRSGWALPESIGVGTDSQIRPGFGRRIRGPAVTPDRRGGGSPGHFAAAPSFLAVCSASNGIFSTPW